MTASAPGFDPNHVSDAIQRADAAEDAYMENNILGDSEERIHVLLSAALDRDELVRLLDDAAGKWGDAPDSGDDLDLLRALADALIAHLLGSES